MLKIRKQQKELIDDYGLAGEDLRQNLDEFIFFNYWFGGKHTLLKALNKVYRRYQTTVSTQELIIADLGCGAGDLLQATYQWAKIKKIPVKLTGIDVNAFIIAYAMNKFKVPACDYQVGNILTTKVPQEIDIACLNSVCHHFNNEELIRLLRQLKVDTKMVIIINDLRRNYIAYLAVKWLTRLFNFSNLTRNDAPLSVLKAFRKHELKKILNDAGIYSYQISRSWAFRWQIIIWC